MNAEEFRHTELQAFKDRAVSVEAVKDELMDEKHEVDRVQQSTDEPESPSFIGSRLSIGGDEN